MIRFSGEVSNIVERVYKMADQNPHEIALILANGEKLTYLDVFQKTQSLRQEIVGLGFQKGQRVLVLFPFDEKFVFLIMAFFAENIVPVIIDPRVPQKLWKNLLKENGIENIFLTKKIKKWRFLAWWMNAFKLHCIDNFFKSNLVSDRSLLKTQDADEVLVTLTSGTTGLPKIVSRNFGVLKTQQLLSCKYLPSVSRDTHLALYGIGVLQSLAEGATSVLLPTELHKVNILVETIQKYKVTRLSGPPGLMTDFILHLEKEKISLPALENIITGGAPLPRWWTKKAHDVLPETEITILYGSTECEPISFFSAQNIDSDREGYPVGRPVGEVTLTKKSFSNIKGLDIFEIILEGPNCVSPEGGLETGDLAVEENGCLWLLGRKSEAIKNIPVALIEEPLERFDGIKRVAAQLRGETLQLYCETIDGAKISRDFENSAQTLCEGFGFSQIQVRQVRKIPVDPRHGWKIQRKQLLDL